MRPLASVSPFLFVLAALGCAPAPSVIPPPNEPIDFLPTDSPFDRAFADFAEGHDLRALRVPTREESGEIGGIERPQPPGDVVVEGLGPGESVVLDARPGDAVPRLTFKTPPFSDYCSPLPHEQYGVALDRDGAVIIVRLVPKVTFRDKHIAGSCAVGCGPVPPPPSSRLLTLPDAKLVRVVPAEWEVEVERITCDDPIPAQ